MATDFKKFLNQVDADKFIKNYKKETEVKIGEQFGSRVEAHVSRVRSKGNNSFQLFSMSFDPNRTDVHGFSGLKMVITDLDISKLPKLTGTFNRYRVFLGLKDDGTRIDILAHSQFTPDPTNVMLGSFSPNNVFFEIIPDNERSVIYDYILLSARVWDAFRPDVTDPDTMRANESEEYSWLCEPHCP